MSLVPRGFHRLEIYQVAQPLDYRQFCHELSRAHMADVPIAKDFLQEVSSPVSL